MATELDQSRQVESLKTLGNKKLDANEINFLKSQDTLLLDFVDNAEKNLLTDIREANRDQIKKDVRLNELLNGYIVPENFDKIVKNIMPNIKFSNTFDSINLYTWIRRKFDALVAKTADDSTWFRPKMFMIRFLLDVERGHVKSWYEKTLTTVFDGNFVKMLHAFQKKTQAGVSERSDVDCIVGKRTIQQLAAYTGVGAIAGEVNIDAPFTVSNEIEKKEIYNPIEVPKYIKQIEKNSEISPTQKINDILKVYSKLPETYREKHVISVKKQTIKELAYQTIQNIMSKYQVNKEEVDESLLKEFFNVSFPEILNLQEVNQKKLTVALGLATAWMKYYEQESTRANKKLLPLISEGIKHLQHLQNKNSSGDINREIQSAMALILWPTDFNLMNHDFQRAYIRTRRTWVFANPEYFGIEINAGMQEYTFKKMSDLITWNNNRDDNSMVSLRNNLLAQFRTIDANYDGGIFDDYKSWGAIIEEMESYSGTGQSIMNMKIEENGNWKENKEYKKYNTDVSNVNAFFGAITKTDAEGNLDPDPKKMKAFDLIFTELDKWNIKIVTHNESKIIDTWEKPIYDNNVWDEIECPKTVLDAITSILGFGFDINTWKKLIGDYKKIQKQLDSQKSVILEEVKNTYRGIKKDIDSDIQYYDSMIWQFPNDAKAEEWKASKQWLVDAKNQLLNENQLTYTTPIQKDSNGNDISVESILQWQKKSYFGQILETACVSKIMMVHQNWAIKKMQNKENKTAGEEMIDRYTNILGYWSYMSDKTFNMCISIAKEVLVQVVICAVSAGIGNLVAKWVMVWTKRALNTVKLTKTANQVGRFYRLGAGNIIKTFKLIERGVKMGKITKAAWSIAKLTTTLSRSGRMVAAGSIFHASSRVLNNLYSWQDILTWLNPLGYTEYVDENGEVQKISNYRWYLQSIAFFGVLEIVAPGIQNLLSKAKGNSKKINEIISNVMKQKSTMKEFKIDFGAWAKNNVLVPVGSVTWEVASLMATETILSIVFDQKLPSFDTESIIHMIGMVIGLRMTHWVKLWLEGKMDKYMVKDVTYKPWTTIKDVTSIDLVTFETFRDGKTYETVINSKSEIIETTDPLLRKWTQVKQNETWARSTIPNRASAWRNQTAENISQNRNANGESNVNKGLPTEVEVRSWEKIQIERDGPYKDLLDIYEKLIQEKPAWYEAELTKLDIQLAERITLDRGRSIEYTSEIEARGAFSELSKMKTYNEQLRVYKNFEWKRCVEKLYANSVLPNLYISWDGYRGVDYTWATVKKVNIPIANLKTGDQIFSERWGKRYEFAKKDNWTREVISNEWRFDIWDVVKLTKNKDGSMTFERVGDGRKMEVNNLGLQKMVSPKTEIITQESIEKAIEDFDAAIMSEAGITIDGKNYKMIYEPNMTQNQSRKWTWKFIVDGKVETSVKSENGKVLPDNADGNRIRERYYETRDQYLTMKESDMKIVVEQSQSIQDKLEEREAQQDIKNIPEVAKSEVKQEKSSQSNIVQKRIDVENPDLQNGDVIKINTNEFVYIVEGDVIKLKQKWIDNWMSAEGKSFQEVLKNIKSQYNLTGEVYKIEIDTGIKNKNEQVEVSNPEIEKQENKASQVEWKVEQLATETNVEKTIQRAMEKAKEMWEDYVVVVKNDIRNSEVFVVTKTTDFVSPVEMRFKDGRVETGSRKNGMLEGDGKAEFMNNYRQQISENWIFENGILRNWERTIRANRNETIMEKWTFGSDGKLKDWEYKIERQLENILWKTSSKEVETEIGPRKNEKLEWMWIKEYENTGTWEKVKSEWIFKNWELREGKVTDNNGKVIKEYAQWKEVVKAGAEVDIEKEIILCGLRDWFVGNTYNAFDVRSVSDIMEKIDKWDSFFTNFTKGGKEYMIVGLKIEQDVGPIYVGGRDGWSFAVIEKIRNLPNNIKDILIEKAKNNWKVLYPQIKNMTFKEIKAEIDSENMTNTVSMENRNTQDYIENLNSIRNEENKDVIDGLIKQLNEQSNDFDNVINNNKSVIEDLFKKAA